MKKSIDLGKVFLLPQVLSILLLLHCFDGLPQKELAEARLILSFAEEEDVPNRNAEPYSEAKNNLLEAHKYVADKDFGKAKQLAENAIVKAMEAREGSFPGYLDLLSQEANKLIILMEDRAAEIISPDDFQIAKESYDEGLNKRKEGDSKSGQYKDKELEEDKKIVLQRKAHNDYREAALSFKKITKIETEFRNAIISHSLEVAESIKLAKLERDKAQLYGASKKQLLEPTSKIAEADKLYSAKNYVKAGEAISSARDSLLALLTAMEPLYAKKILKKAEKLVAKASKHYAKTDSSEAREDAIKSKALDAVKTQVIAAEEAKDTAISLLGEENYADSIKESENAILLSKTIIEQFSLIASRGGNALITSDGKGIVEDIGGGWKRYTVRDKNPSDCLWCIAARPEVYGSGLLWNRIHKVNKNKIKDPNVIHPGQILFIPPRKGDFGNPPGGNSETETEVKAGS